MIDLNHGPKPASIGGTINELIDKALVARNTRSAGRRYVGASSIGGECERAIQLDYIRANDLPAAPVPDADKDLSGKTLRVFQAGHLFEEMAIDWLKVAGFDVRTRDKEGGQFGFSTAGGRFAGHCDGVIVSGPPVMAYPALWEHKALGHKSWQDVAKNGVAKAKPAYAAQIAIYQAYLDLPEPALFQATNRDTQEVIFEAVPFDGALAQRMSDRAVRVIQETDAGTLLPKAFHSADHFICKWCRWHGFCWPSEAAS